MATFSSLLDSSKGLPLVSGTNRVIAAATNIRTAKNVKAISLLTERNSVGNTNEAIAAPLLPEAQ